ncbi:MAG: hypothetical protein AABY16_04845 [Nanoarchaeota archaeon]
MLKISLVLSVLAVVLIFAVAYFYDSVAGVDLREATGLVVSAESFPTYLETHPLFDDLPEKTNFEINFGDDSYAVSGGSVTANAVAENPDFSVSLPEEYASRVGEIGLCAALKEAINNGEIQVSAEISKFELFLKYRKLVKYRDCLA